MRQQGYNLRAVRQIVNDVYTLEELRTLCLEEFRSIYDDYNEEKKSTLIRHLVEYCDRKGRVEYLLGCIKRDAPQRMKDLDYLLDKFLGSEDALEQSRVTLSRQSSFFGEPPLPHDFIGRNAEKSALLEILEQSNKKIFWIGGISGIGKTYLAAWLCNNVRRSYDFQPLWVNCQEQSLTLEVLLNALSEISDDKHLKALGPLDGK